jgi:hypothetical protein
MTDGLKNLIRSAELSGVQLRILGLGATYNDYSDKLRNYIRFFTSALRETDGEKDIDVDGRISNTVNVNPTASATQEGTEWTMDGSHRTVLYENEYLDLRDDDTVMLIDAYDVLLFPAVRRAGLVSYPIAVCAAIAFELPV